MLREKNIILLNITENSTMLELYQCYFCHINVEEFLI